MQYFIDDTQKGTVTAGVAAAVTGFIATAMMAFVKENLTTNKNTWLDVGCGVGEILSAAKNQGFDVHGVPFVPGVQRRLEECLRGVIQIIEVVVVLGVADAVQVAKRGLEHA